MKLIARYFIQGLLIVLPFGVTILILVELVNLLGSLFSSFDVIVHPVVDFFILLLLAFFIVLFTGFMGSSLLFQPMFQWAERNLERAPLIKVIYTSVKVFMSAFVGKKKRFNKPVVVELDKENQIWQLGFITQESVSAFNLGEEFISVYLPFSYGFNGKLILVNREKVKKLDISSTEAMKFIVSGGVTELE